MLNTHTRLITDAPPFASPTILLACAVEGCAEVIAEVTNRDPGEVVQLAELHQLVHRAAGDLAGHYAGVLAEAAEAGL